MNYIINGYNPPELFKYFEEISTIPRESGKEKSICEYLRNFAKKKRLEFFSDEHNNCLITKAASAGFEARPALLLQSHTDMVCEKNAGIDHDFASDGLDLYIEDGFLHARGTTLGADDGIGVAAMLAILSDSSLAHPPLECLFTADEEVGMNGAFGFDYSKITAKRLINLDSGIENEAIAGCAGGAKTEIRYSFDRVKNDNKVMKITLKGLCGGHSGADINRGRASAIKLITRILASVYDKMPFNLISLSSGTKITAIPREAEAVIAVIDFEETKKLVLECEKIIEGELSGEDNNFVIHISKSPACPECLTYRDTRRLLSLLTILPSGVIGMMRTLPDVVETSSNIGIVTMDFDHARIQSAVRSSASSKLEHQILAQKMISKEFDCTFSVDGHYPSWAYKENTDLQKVFRSAYSALFSDRAPNVTAIHAGLECGIFAERIEGIDAVSIGPDMFDIHTPYERLSLSSCERFYALLRRMTESL